MSWVLMGICLVLTIELFFLLRISIPFGISRQVAQKASRVLLSPAISDHWKEKALQVYSLRLFLNSLQLGFRLLLVFLPFILVALVPLPAGEQFRLLAVSYLGIIVCTIAGVFYVSLRSFILRPK